MSVELIDSVPLGAFFAIVLVLLLLAIECGYRFGEWMRSHHTGEKDQPVSAMVASMLGLLALVLGFTFALAGSRFDARRMAVLDDANAIGTTYLRTSFLPEPQRTVSRQRLRDYVDARLLVTQRGRAQEAVQKSEALHAELWRAAAEAAALDSHSTMTAIYVQSLNGMIDMHARRVLVGLRSRIPLVLWGALMWLALLSMSAIGYQSGLSATKRSPAMFALALSFAIVVLMIADLDRGYEGLFRVSQQSIVDVRRSIEETTP
jgi:hypothetical protein